MRKPKSIVSLFYLAAVLLCFVGWWWGWRGIHVSDPDKRRVYAGLEQGLLRWELALPLRSTPPPSDDVVVVSFGENATKVYGPLPWPRDVFAELITRLRALGSKTIVMDPLFADPQLKFLSPSAYQSLFPALNLRQIRIVNPHNYVGELVRKLAQQRTALERRLAAGQLAPTRLAAFDQQSKALISLSRRIAAGDASVAFEAAIRAKRDVVFPTDYSNAPMFAASPQEALQLLRRQAVPGVPNPERITQFDHVLTLYPRLWQQNPMGGMNEIETEPPHHLHFIRDARALVRFDGRVYFASMVRALAHYLDAPARLAQMRDGLHIVLGDRDVRLEEDGRFPLAYYRQDTFPRALSAIDVLRDRMPRQAIAGKLVIVDIRNEQTASFLRRMTPGHGRRWVSDLKATFASNMLLGHRGPTIRRPTLIPLLEGALIWLIGVAFVWITYRAPLWRSLMAGVGMFAIMAMINLLILVPQGLWFAAGIIAIEIALLMLLSVGAHYLLQRSERRKLRRAFGFYLAEPVLEHMLQDEHALQLGGERRTLSVLFSDIRGFTNLSENASAEALGMALNAHLTQLTRAVFEHRGTLDKYMGDCVMAFFGAPVPIGEHALCAVRAALRMQQQLQQVQPVWKDNCGSEAKIGVGVATGDVVVGNMGSDTLFDYTVIGDTVNLASRLEGLTKVYGVDVLVSEATRQATKDEVTYLEVDVVRVKGKQKPVAVYEAVCEGKPDEARSMYHECCQVGLRAYRGQQWQDGITQFEKAAKLRPEARLPALYLQRIARLSVDPPGSDWDGVSEFHQK